MVTMMVAFSPMNYLCTTWGMVDATIAVISGLNAFGPEDMAKVLTYFTTLRLVKVLKAVRFFSACPPPAFRPFPKPSNPSFSPPTVRWT
eukprot:8460571-Pyramimonas_sp.AAC.1